MEREHKGGGFFQVPDAVLDDTRLSGRAKLIYCVLRRYADRNGRCFPSLETIGKQSSISSKTVKRHIDDLVASGWVERRTEKKKDRYIGYVYLTNTRGML